MKSRRLFYPGNRFLILYLSFLSAFAPISTDMYLPALPSIAQTFATTNELASATISTFILIFAVSMLFWGPISDRYGRKPVLLAGSLLYIVASAAICLTSSIEAFLVWRGVQALGSGAASAMSLAVVKDVLRGGSMENVVAVMQATVIIAPLTAPVLGGWLLLAVDWRGIFLCLGLCGALALLGALCLQETNPHHGALSLGATFRRMGSALANRNFLYPLLIFSAMSMPFMSYLAVSAFIFQDTFHVSAQQYSLFFALNAFCSLLGPFLHMGVLRHRNRDRVLAAHLLIMCAAGVAIILWGGLGPWAFALLFAPLSLCGSAMRAPSTVLMMESIQGDNGIVASLINCAGLLFGALSMLLASLTVWPGAILAVGSISTVV
ncbi:MAG: Bcr/CflA family efflux MFS transporter, partial [Desulfovibrio sp.]|nr:Bcr/CflA family efflux MFS transporter [Desulfovibrio sp.]